MAGRQVASMQRAKADKLRDDYIDRGQKAVEHAKDQVDKAWEQFKTIDTRELLSLVKQG